MTGVNNVAACLVRAKALACQPNATVTIKGADMNHTVEIELSDGRSWTIRSAWDWFAVRPILRRSDESLHC